jgi:hypothetical protein
LKVHQSHKKDVELLDLDGGNVDMNVEVSDEDVDMENQVRKNVAKVRKNVAKVRKNVAKEEVDEEDVAVTQLQQKLCMYIYMHISKGCFFLFGPCETCVCGHQKGCICIQRKRVNSLFFAPVNRVYAFTEKGCTQQQCSLFFCFYGETCVCIHRKRVNTVKKKHGLAGKKKDEHSVFTRFW